MISSPRRLVGPTIVAFLAVALIAGAASLVGSRGRPGDGGEPKSPAGTAPASSADRAAAGGGTGGSGTAAEGAVALGPVIPADWTPPSPVATAAALGGRPPHDPAKFGFAGKGMKGEVTAFMTQAEMPYVRDTADLSAISTVAFFGLQADSKGRLLKNAGWRAWNSKDMDRIRERLHKAGAKLVVSIVRFSWNDKGTAVSRAVLASPALRQRLADQIADAVRDQEADGVNLDFEPIPTGQKANFTDLTRRVRAALDKRRAGLQLTVAITGYFTSYDVKGLAAAADAIFLMGYHYAGWWSRYAGSTSPMGGSRLNVVGTVANLRKAGIRPEQIVVGIPYYAHLWPTKTGAVHARTTGRGRDLNVREALAILAKVGRRWDPVEQTAWGRWRENGSWYQIYVDDPGTLRRKWSRFQDLGLLGTGMWSIGKEGAPGRINDALRASWLVEP